MISDKWRRICEDGEYLVYRADILISTDYYPFGSPMPGRVWEKHVTDTFAVADTLHYTDFESGSVTTIGSYDYMDGWRDDPPYSDLDLFTTMGNRWLEVSSTTCTNGIFQDFVSVAGETYTIEYDIDIGSSGGVNLLWWSRPTGGSWTYRGVLQFSNTSGHRSVSFTVPTGAGEVRLQFRKNTCSSTPQYFLLDNIWIYDLNDQVVTFTPGGYRFGFNGMEKTDEWQGAGMEYTTEYRQYDPRLGRWMSIDPLAQQFPHQSPYVGMDNNPVALNDPQGGRANCPTCPFGGGSGGNQPVVQTLPSAGDLLGSVAERMGIQGTGVDAAAGFVGQFFPNTYNMAAHRINTLVNNPTRLLAPVDAYHGIVEGIKGAKDLATGISKGDATSIGQGAAILTQVVGGGLAAGRQIMGNAKNASVAESGSTVTAEGPPKLLNQFNSAESLIEGAGELKPLKGGTMQGAVTGNGEAIYNAISQGGETMSNGAVQLSNGTILYKYVSSTTGEFTIHINQSGTLYKIRINP